jgi:hypothetical protein
MKKVRELVGFLRHEEFPRFATWLSRDWSERADHDSKTARAGYQGEAPKGFSWGRKSRIALPGLYPRACFGEVDPEVPALLRYLPERPLIQTQIVRRHSDIGIA